MSTQVNHPSHYNSGKIEVIEAIEDWSLNYHRGNSVKYIARAGKKDSSKEIEDLEKAAWYLKREIERLKAKKENREPLRPNDMNPRSTSATVALSSAPRELPPAFVPPAPQVRELLSKQAGEKPKRFIWRCKPCMSTFSTNPKTTMQCPGCDGRATFVGETAN